MATTGIAPGDIVGLTNGVRSTFLGPDFFNTVKFEAYPTLNAISTKRMRSDGSANLQWTIRTDANGTFRKTLPHQRDAVNLEDNTVQGKLGWTWGDVHWGIDDRELDANQGAEQIYSIVQERRASAMEAAANGFEGEAWDVPENSGDSRSAHGIPAHILMGPAGANAPAFNGQTLLYRDGTSTTTVSNIDRSSADNERVRNATATYTNVDKTFVRRLRHLMIMSQFNPPSLLRDGDLSSSNTFRLMVPLSIMLDFEEALDEKHQNFTNDLARGERGPVFRGVPVERNPQLETDVKGSTHVIAQQTPVFGVNFDFVELRYLRDRWFVERPTMQDPNSHNRAITWVDFSYQWIATNVRYGGFVLHTAISA